MRLTMYGYKMHTFRRPDDSAHENERAKATSDS
jgi:hypothetical protein